MAVATKKITAAQRDQLIDELLADRAAEQFAEVTARSPREQHTELMLAYRRAGKVRRDIEQLEQQVEGVARQRELRVRRGAHVDEIAQLDEALLPASSQLDRLRAELRDVETLQAALAPGEQAFEAEKAEQAKDHAPARLQAARARAAEAAALVAKEHDALASAVQGRFWGALEGHLGAPARYGRAVARQMFAAAYLAEVEAALDPKSKLKDWL